MTMKDEKLPITGFGDEKPSQFGLREIPVIEERKREMTMKERVEAILKMPWRPDPDLYGPGRREFLDREELVRRFEEAIIAAIQEEREACAKILDAEAEEASTYLWEHAMEEIAEKIRARGNRD
jgi:hypothetical protein